MPRAAPTIAAKRWLKFFELKTAKSLNTGTWCRVYQHNRPTKTACFDIAYAAHHCHPAAESAGSSEAPRPGPRGLRRGVTYLVGRGVTYLVGRGVTYLVGRGVTYLVGRGVTYLVGRGVTYLVGRGV